LQIQAEQNSVQKSTDPNSGTTRTAIGKVALGLSAIAVFSKVFGFAEKLIVAHFFGTDARADVYFASMGIVLSLVFLVKELIYPSVLPVFAQTLKISFYASSDLFRKIFFRLFSVLAVFAVIAVLFSDVITSILVPGFSEDKKILTSSLLKFLAPACLFMCLMTFTQSVLNCRRSFFKAAIPETGFKFLIVIGLIALAPMMDIYALAVAALIGSVLAFILQFIFIPESKAVLAYSVYNAKDEFSRILKLAGPLVLGVVFSHISGLVDNMLASTLPTGQLSYLGYSKKLIDAILLVGPIALVTVVYSQLSHLNAEGKSEEFKTLFIRAFRLILFVSIPASVVLIMLREPVVAAMFERGRFTYQSTLGTSQALLIYAIGFVTFAVEALVVFGFYALSNTKVPVRVGIFAVLLDIILAVTLIGPFGFSAIAWAYVFSKTVKVIILLLVMDRKFRFLHDKMFINFVLSVAVSCLVSAFCLYLLKSLNQGSSFLQKFAFDLAIPASGFAAAFLLCCRLFNIEELNLLSTVLLRRKNLKSQLSEDIS
jgi:putative peptidoglycan lipid II flippase